MLCNHCGSKQATYHKTTIRNGTKNEIHLCGVCAQKTQVVIEPSVDLFKNLNIGEFFEEEVLPAQRRVPMVKKCNNCGTKITDFQKSARLGCAQCYAVFADDILGIIGAMHGNGAVHKGKRA